ncbi:replication-relaxation family protein [Streptomyces agglomeratus]|uniref:replication-relaxation family protein n=1 Tax=Streptomyces agglomeratus TaxID=285458 RepID=UPI00099F7294|nr:replication-relaxation family protein [Streptomyces agglomeratus]
MTPVRRLTASRLSQLADSLTEWERQVLRLLATCHLATADQVARGVFGGHRSATAQRLAHRHLLRLTQLGLTRFFTDQSRVRWPGRPGHVHALTTAGVKLTEGAATPGARQRSNWRPADAFLTHRLAITELYVRLVEEARTGRATVREFRAETDAWRTYRNPLSGRPCYVRPDALLRVVTAGLELSWFIELDRATESPRRIDAKCRAYRSYELSGMEQGRYGIFPGVIFIVPDQPRAGVIQRVISQQPAEARGLYVVTTDAAAVTALTTPPDDGTAAQPALALV